MTRTAGALRKPSRHRGTHRTHLADEFELVYLAERVAALCALCAVEEHEECVSAGELGAADVCGCWCHL